MSKNKNEDQGGVPPVRTSRRSLRKPFAAVAAVAAVTGVAVVAVTAFGGGSGSQSPAAVPGGTSHHATAKVTLYPYSSPAAPYEILAFNSAAKGVPGSRFMYRKDWNSVLRQQRHDLRHHRHTAAYDAFLQQFDGLKGEPLVKLATGVNTIVEQNISYSKGGSHWAPPDQTARKGKGDSKDQAALLYDVMHSLGVPASRLFIAGVNTKDKTRHANEAVLLVNIAPEGAWPRLFIMNGSAPAIPETAATFKAGEQPQDYRLFDLISGHRYWETSLDRKIYRSNHHHQAPYLAGNHRAAKKKHHHARR